MATFLWIGKGVYSIYKTRDPEKNGITSVPIFGKKIIQTSFWGYILILTSTSILVGTLLNIPVLTAGLMLFFCFVWWKKLKSFSDNYLNINI